MESKYIDKDDDADKATQQGLLTEPIRVRVLTQNIVPIITIRR